MDTRFQLFQQEVDARFQFFQQEVDVRFQFFQQEIDHRLQQFEQHIDRRFVDVENGIGSLRGDMIERFNSAYDHIDGQAKILQQKFELAEKRTAQQFADMKQHFDTKFNFVHERFVEVQEDLDQIRQQPGRKAEVTNNTPRRPSAR